MWNDSEDGEDFDGKPVKGKEIIILLVIAVLALGTVGLLVALK